VCSSDLLGGEFNNCNVVLSIKFSGTKYIKYVIQNLILRNKLRNKEQ
jgi:hypothetical protein